MSTCDKRDYVILLHGLARTSRSMRALEKVLGVDYQVINLSYPSKKYPIQKLSEIAIPAALDKCHSNSKIHFVTHSLGGILLRQYLSNKKIENLGRTVMLGPPNQGSELADFFFNSTLYRIFNGPAGLQLGTKQNKVQKSLPLELGAVNFDVGVIAGNRSINPLFSNLIKGPDDGKVSVKRSKVKNMNDHIVLSINHTFMMFSTNLHHQVKHYLATGKFDQLI